MMPLSVAGSGARIGENCTVLSGVRIYPDIKIPPEATLRRTVTLQPSGQGLFEGGEVRSGLTCELCAALGGALAPLTGKARRVLIGHDGPDEVRMLADAFSSGLRAAGCDAYECDIGFAAGVAGVAGLLGSGVSVFLSGGGEPSLRIFGRNELPISAETQKKLDGAIARGEYARSSGEPGKKHVLSGTAAFYAVARAGKGEGGGMVLSVSGRHPAATALAETLKSAGFDISGGGAVISVAEDGFSFSVSDGETRAGAGDCRALSLLAACLSGKIKTAALPYSDPDAYELMAARHGCRMLRLERDGREAERLYESQEFLHDAAGGAVCLFSLIAAGKHTLAGLMRMLPDYAQSSVEVELGSERGKIMRELAKACDGMSVELVDGLKIFTDGGYVRAVPSTQKSALRISAESFSSEIAAELAADFADRTRRLDLKDRNLGK